MDCYLSAWKTFRRLSDENEKTAIHLLSRRRFPRRDRAVLLDIGCGDGRLVEKVTLGSRSSFAEVRLVDPDPELLGEAASVVLSNGIVRCVRAVLGGIEEYIESQAQGVDAILIVHVVYLLEIDELRVSLGRLPKGIPAYVVLDDPGSVFTSLWRRTAPTYHRRVVGAHELVEALDPHAFLVSTSSVTSHIRSPISTEMSPDVREALLSILCYADLGASEQADIRAWVEEQLTERETAGEIACRSTCYEIVRL